MNDQELLEEAIGIAVSAHRGQKDGYGAPYILHPLGVMQRLSSPHQQIVAVLHDVVEGTDWTSDPLAREAAPAPLLAAYTSATKIDGEDDDDCVKRSAAKPLETRAKLSDREDNSDIRRASEVTEKELTRL